MPSPIRARGRRDFVARNDAELVLRKVDLGAHDVEVQGWPDDPDWADFVAEQVGSGVPVLEDLIGENWPAESDVDVVETVAPYLYGYGGWYQPNKSLIEVGDELEQQIILHELSHVWFNADLFDGRWISEGLADDFAARTMDELKAEVPTPDEVRADDPGAQRLNTWSDPDFQDGQSDDQERYGYNTSWSVIARVDAGDRSGTDAGRAPPSAARRRCPTAPTRCPGVLTRRADWRTLLDLFEEVGGSTKREQVFRDLVVTPEQATLLPERAKARTKYAASSMRAQGWAPPRSVRTDMSDWHFDDAVAALPEATDVLAVRDDLALQLAPIHEKVPTAFQRAYEGRARPRGPGHLCR